MRGLSDCIVFAMALHCSDPTFLDHLQGTPYVSAVPASPGTISPTHKHHSAAARSSLQGVCDEDLAQMKVGGVPLPGWEDDQVQEESEQQQHQPQEHQLFQQMVCTSSALVYYVTDKSLELLNRLIHTLRNPLSAQLPAQDLT